MNDDVVKDDVTKEQIAGVIDRMRTATPLVQCITNYVAMDFAANLLLAAGASPAMAHAAEEADEFVAISGALTVNTGTLSSHWVDGMREAVLAAKRHGTPWVLDPVGCGATVYRTRICRELAGMHPQIIRANAGEVIALAGDAGGVVKGVDSLATTDDAVAIAKDMATRAANVVAVTGESDFITDGTRNVRIAGGHPMMTRITAMGCSLSALTGAMLAVEEDAMLAACAACGMLKVAGEQAAEGAGGPASLRNAILDRLYHLDGSVVAQAVRLV